MNDLSKTKNRWQFLYTIFGIIIILIIIIFFRLYSTPIELQFNVPSEFKNYIFIILLATISAFYFDLYGVWTMFVFPHSNIFIKYSVIVFSFNILLLQAIFYFIFGNIGFLVGYVFASIMNNIITFYIYRYSLRGKIYNPL